LDIEVPFEKYVTTLKQRLFAYEQFALS